MFKKRLRQLRLDSELNQPELAKKLNVAKQTISNWENGNRTPDNDMLIKIADYFNCSVDYILGRTDDPNAKIYKANVNGDEIEIAINKNYPHELSPEEVEKLIQQLQEVGFDINKLIEKAKIKDS